MSKFQLVIGFLFIAMSCDVYAREGCGGGGSWMDGDSCLETISEPGTVKTSSGWKMTYSDGQESFIKRSADGGCCEYFDSTTRTSN